MRKISLTALLCLFALSVTTFATELKPPKPEPVEKADITVFSKKPAGGTPTVFIDGKPVYVGKNGKPLAGMGEITPDDVKRFRMSMHVNGEPVIQWDTAKSGKNTPEEEFKRNVENMRRIHDEWERFWNLDAPLARPVTHAKPAKTAKPERLARAVFFPASHFAVEQFAGLGLLAQLRKAGDSEAGQAAQATAIITGDSISVQASASTWLTPLIQHVGDEVSVSAILVGKMGDTANQNGVWLILYGEADTVTELARVLEMIAKNTPENTPENVPNPVD